MLLLVTLVIILAPSIYAQTKTATATSSSVSAKSTGNNYTMNNYVDNTYLLVMCGSNGNTDTICSPKPNDTWKNGTWYPITWNSMQVLSLYTNKRLTYLIGIHPMCQRLVS